MKFKIDENLPIEVAELLQKEGYKCKTVQEQSLKGSTDSRIISVCRSEERVIVTLDMDFSDIRSYPPEQYSGIVVLRLERQDKLHVLEAVRQFIQILASEPLAQRLWIVEEGRIRIRR